MSGGSTILRLGAASQDGTLLPDDATLETAKADAEGEAQTAAFPHPIDESADQQDYASEWPDEWTEDVAEASIFERMLAPALWVGAAIWTGLYLWTQWPALAQIGWNGSAITGITAARVPAMMAEWALPIVLIMLTLLIARRTSDKEARRFADVSAILRNETVALESRLRTINSELSLAREFISAQSRDLDTLGRVAGERLSAHADKIAGLIHDNGSQIDQIASVSTTALDNMERLRGHLPVIANSAKDVTNQIANSGRVAQAQLKELIAGFNRINEFGQASETQVIALRERIDAALEEITAGSGALLESTQTSYNFLLNETRSLSQSIKDQEAESQLRLREELALITTEGRSVRAQLADHEAQALSALNAQLAAVRDQSGNLVARLDEGHQTAIAAAEQRMTLFEQSWAESQARLAADQQAAEAKMQQSIADLALGAEALQADLIRQADVLLSAIEERRIQLDEVAGSDIDALEARLAAWEQRLTASHARQLIEAGKVADQTGAITSQLEACEARIAALQASGQASRDDISTQLETLAASTQATLEQLISANSAVADLTDGSVRLLELIQASSQHTEEHLPLALVRTEEQLNGMENRVFALRDALAEAGTHGSSIAQTLTDTGSALAQTRQALDAIDVDSAATARQQQDVLAQTRSGIAEASSQLADLAQASEARLAETLANLRGELEAALAVVPARLTAELDAVSGRFRDQTGETLENLVEERLAALTAGVEAANARAIAASAETAQRIEAQLARVEQLTGTLETRIDAARAASEQDVDGEFARRMALITESLNSTSIDIAKLFSNEVSDTAWQSYLRGDRGVFTRRAVRLLDTAEARAIAQHYDTDPEFRDSTNRYIHDFEAMLRGLLSTRDGNALSVTMLSSDMGKLYVALAQGIERLRN